MQLGGARQASAAVAAERPESLTYWQLIQASPFRHKAFLIMISLQCLTVIIERIVLFALSDKSDEGHTRESVYFLAIILVSMAFVGYFAVHGIVQTNSFEMGAFFVASIMLLIRLAVEAANRTEECDDTLWLCYIFLGLAVLFILGAMAFTVTIAKDLEWKRYKAIGADISTRSLYRSFELFSAVRKLDMQFSIITLITGIVFFRPASSGSSASTPGAFALGINLIMFLVEIAWELLGDAGVKSENTNYLIVFWALSLFLPVFIVTIAVDVFGPNELLSGATSQSVRLTIAIMAALALINRVATVAVSIRLYMSFGPAYVGLKRIIATDRKAKFNRHRVSKRLPSDVPAVTGAAPVTAAAGSSGPNTTPLVTLATPSPSSVVANPLSALVSVVPSSTVGIAEWGISAGKGGVS